VKDVLVAACITTSDKEREVFMKRLGEETTHSLVPLRPERSTPRPNNPQMEKSERQNNQNQGKHKRRPGNNSVQKLIHSVSTSI
jgi:hypothetical protein